MLKILNLYGSIKTGTNKVFRGNYNGKRKKKDSDKI